MSFLCACTQAFPFSHPKKNLKKKKKIYHGWDFEDVGFLVGFLNGPTQKKPVEMEQLSMKHNSF
jgi:hypothetical protein